MSAQPPTQEALALDLRGISKQFGDLWANLDVDLRARPGECHAVVGENGAGKSTLMHVVFGHYKPERGEIRIGGAPKSFGSPRDAVRAGIGMVHQQLLIFPQLTALENVLVGGPTDGILLSSRHSRARAAVLELNRSAGLDLPLDSPARDLSFAQRQQIELVRALYRSARILILDEPTSLLSPPEVQRLLDLLQSLKERGHTLLFVSHRLSEVFAVADRITVLRGGSRVGVFDTGLTSPEVIARLMAAPREPRSRLSSLQVSRPSAASASGDTPGGEMLLEMRGIRVPQYRSEAAIENIDLCLRSGEVLGIGGVVGNGQRTLAHVIAGHAAPSSGALLFEGRDWARVPVGERLEQGLRWLPANLAGEGFCPGLTLWQNCLLGRQNEARFQNHGWLRKNVVRRWTRNELREGGVKFSDVELPVETLSGGNAQRMGLLRVFNGSPRLVLLEQPGRGLDLRAREWLREQVRDLSRRGAAILVISYDLDELLELCDRIGILYRGRLMGLAPGDGSAVESLVRWMTGIES